MGIPHLYGRAQKISFNKKSADVNIRMANMQQQQQTAGGAYPEGADGIT